MATTAAGENKEEATSAERPMGPQPTIATTSPGGHPRRGRQPRTRWGGCRPGTEPARRSLHRNRVGRSCRRRARVHTRLAHRRSGARRSSPRLETLAESPSRQNRQCPHAEMQDKRTRSPFLRRGRRCHVPSPCQLPHARESSRGHLGDVALQDVKVGAANGHRVDLHDRVGIASSLGSGTSSQLFCQGRDRRPLALRTSVFDRYVHGRPQTIEAPGAKVLV